jgi:hypothetical protein
VPIPVPKEKEQCKDDDGDDCKQKASDWELKQAGIDAHEAKDGLGQAKLFEICKWLRCQTQRLPRPDHLPLVILL